MIVSKRKIEDFFDNEYLAYAKYVVENRAIPSLVDGFKPTQRKAACAADKYWKTGNEKPLKVFQLAGTVAATMFYHHGNASLESTIIGMAQDFKNSMPIFHGIGQFGSLRSPEAGAPRYVGVKFNDNFRLLYKDFDLLDSRFEEGEEIEPQFFLPVIPTVLLNGGSGIAVGFATNILNRNPIDLIDACLAHLDGKKTKVLKPWLRNFYGTFTQDPENPKSWVIRGEYEIKNTSSVEVTEIPPSFTYEKYENHLNNLVEKGTITSYDDMSSGRVHYVLKFNRQKLAELVRKKKLEETLKLIERETENLTMLDENGNLKIFNDPADIVSYFTDFRLAYYHKRKAKIIEKLTEELLTLTNKSRFIKSIIDQKLAINLRTKADLESDLRQMKFDKVNDSWSYLTGLAIHTLTRERFDELQKTELDKRAELIDIKTRNPVDMYRADLMDLRKKIQKSS
jgi:DNA topoisomerase-2